MGPGEQSEWTPSYGDSRWPSVMMRFTAWILSTEPKLMADEATFRATYEGRTYPQPAPPPLAVSLAATVTREQVEGRPVLIVTPKGTPSRWHVVYLHGGGYVSDLLTLHWEIILQVVRHTGATVVVPIYPLAPEHSHAEAHDWVEQVYRWLLTRCAPADVVLMGDSAGGGLALAQAMRYRDRGLPAPARLVLFAPCTSVIPENPEVDAIEARDVVLARAGGALAGRWWAGADDPRCPQVSPLFGDPAGLPPIDIYQGTRDILWPDVRLMADKIARAGGQVRLFEYADGIHVFVGAAFLPESRDVFARIAATFGALERQRQPATDVVSAPPLVFSRQLAVRMREQSTPWIHHVGTRARLHVARTRRAAGRADPA